MYVDDCVEGLVRIMAGNYSNALNLGTDQLVTVDELIDLVCTIAGKRLTKKHDLSKPQGVRGRNSDNTLLHRTLGWEPSIRLEQGLPDTYRWIEAELHKAARTPVGAGQPVG
jgi:nucleoside-diphosphate-sugar epimerase